MYSASVWVGEVGIIEVKSMFFPHSANESKGKKKTKRSRLFFFPYSVFCHWSPSGFFTHQTFPQDAASQIAAWQEIMNLKVATFMTERPHYVCAAIFSTHAHITRPTQLAPAMLCPCAAFCLQTELPWLALLMLIRAPTPCAGLHGAGAVNTGAESQNLPHFLVIMDYSFLCFFSFFIVEWDTK